jgi:hypothetical protein
MRVDRDRQKPLLTLTRHPLTVATAIQPLVPGGWQNTILSASVSMDRPTLASTLPMAASASCDDDVYDEMRLSSVTSIPPALCHASFPKEHALYCDWKLVADVLNIPEMSCDSDLLWLESGVDTLTTYNVLVPMVADVWRCHCSIAGLRSSSSKRSMVASRLSWITPSSLTLDPRIATRKFPSATSRNDD